MAYLVLARKYRPERFAEMIGQEHVTRTLRNAIKEDRVHHAYLFCGVRGLGKTTAARVVAFDYQALDHLLYGLTTLDYAAGALLMTADGETYTYDYFTSRFFTVSQFDFSSANGV